MEAERRLEMTNEIVKVGTGEIVNFEEMAMSIESITAQVGLIQKVMKVVMQKDQHYGAIPGCGDKPTLLKAGAEKLAMTFRLAPEYEVNVVDWQNGHREYQVKCRLRHIPSGNIVGEGHGTCSTMEGKFRFRAENTGRPVPKEYWETRNPDLLGGSTFRARKVDKTWFIFQEVEHPNPADYYNTCEKMGLKRAFVCGILSSTAASDIFTQDIEDMPEVIPGAAAIRAEVHTEPAGARKVNEAEITKFWTEMSKAKAKNDQVHGYLKETFHIDSVKDIPASSLDMIMGACIAALKPSSDAVATPPEDDESLFGEADEPSPAESKAEVPVVLSGVKVPYGDFKGLDYAELPDSEIAKTIKDLDTEKKLSDPKWGTRNQKILDICRAEAERRMKG
jgi:hypothetical protein